MGDRVTGLWSVIKREPRVRGVTLNDGLRSCFAWYGIQRRRIARSLSSRPHSDDLVWVDTGKYGLAWPARAPRDRLLAALSELNVRPNGHYYFRPPTPVRSGDHVLDVGACEGAFALECLLRFGAAHVWCFEPGPTMVAALRETAQGNGLDGRLHVVAAAVADTSGTCAFEENPSNPLASQLVDRTDEVDGQPRLNVARITLDDWADAARPERVDYVKIDAEGADLAVLRGAAGLLRRFRPRIAAAAYHRPEHAREIIDFLGSLEVGYACSPRGVIAVGGVARPVLVHAAVTNGGPHPPA